MANSRKQYGEQNGRNETEAQQKRRRREHSRGGEQADWTGVDGDLIRRCVGTVARAGAAVRFGYSRDGGAFALCVYDGGAGDTEYYPPSTDMDAVLKGLIEDYE